MKIKKVMAMLLAATMIMGSTITTFAATTPTENDAAEVEVSNVDTGATVTAYQIVDGMYNENGFVKYVAVNGVNLTNLLAPTSDEVADIAKKINAGEITLTSVNMSDKDNDGTYEANLNPGSWVVLVRGENGSAKIYNPMLVSVWYSKSGSDNTMTSESVSANDQWTLGAENAWAKSSEVTLTKTAKDSADFGESVEYKINTTIPGYGPEYTAPVFKINDKLSEGDLKLTDGKITVKANNNEVDSRSYTITGGEVGSTEFEVTFNAEWIKDNINADIEISYMATVTADKVNKESHDNTATLTYSSNPGITDTKADTEKVYSFDIGGAATGTNGLIKKVGEDKDAKALKDAEFTLYTDEYCTQQYVNEKHVADEATATSDENGNIYITGLEAGTEGAPVTYYLKETYAPNPYTLNDTVFKIEITANIENEELNGWKIDITDTKTNKKVENNFILNSEGEVQNEGSGVVEIQNTKISSLPSTGGIGTTIFTIGGCAIMITAAGLFFVSRRKVNK